MNLSLEKELYAAIKPLQLEHLSAKLWQYLQLLQLWNKAYNLTAVRTPSEMITRHIVDSLAILPWVRGTRILDVGTGAGLPGIPLAIALPDAQVTLLDSNGKKCRFLLEVKRVLDLQNVAVVQARAESYNPAQGFDTVVSRAFSELQQMLKWTEHVVSQEGIWLAMKGRPTESELCHVPYPYRVENYIVPGDASARCCVIIEKNA